MSIDEYLDILDELMEEGSIVPFSGGNKRVVDIERVRETLDDIRLHMPNEIKQAKAIVQDRNNIVANAKRDSEAILKKTEEKVKTMVASQEIVRLSELKAKEILADAQSKARQMRTSVTDYCENVLKNSEEQLNKSMTEVKTVRLNLRRTSKTKEG